MNDDLDFCEECQDWYPVGEDGTILCECDDEFTLDSHKPLNFND